MWDKVEVLQEGWYIEVWYLKRVWNPDTTQYEDHQWWVGYTSTEVFVTYEKWKGFPREQIHVEHVRVDHEGVLVCEDGP